MKQNAGNALLYPVIKALLNRSKRHSQATWDMLTKVQFYLSIPSILKYKIKQKLGK